MNADELKRNPVLTEHVVKDLNADARLPYEDNAFDVITNTVSVDYLTRPKEARLWGGWVLCLQHMQGSHKEQRGADARRVTKVGDLRIDTLLSRLPADSPVGTSLNRVFGRFPSVCNNASCTKLGGLAGRPGCES